MYTFGSKLKALRTSMNLTQEELANKLNEKYGTSFNKGMISKWENNREEPRMDSMRYLVDFFNISLDDVLGLSVNEEGIEYKVDYVKLPLYGTIAAGALSTVDPVTNENVEYVHIPRAMLGKYQFTKDLFVLKVNGESMNKVIPNGSFVGCKPVEIEEVKDDDIVIFSHDNEYSMKRFRRDEENRLLIFSPESTDRKHHDIVIPYDTLNDLKIYAKVIWYTVILD